MVRWIPGNGQDERAMLGVLGAPSVEELFRDVPARARVKRIGLDPPRTEREVVEHVDRLLARNRTPGEMVSFLGCGIYDRYVPAVVDGILQRSEFYTSYTPYQAEASQGVLQALFEFQSLWVELTDMELANASLYDGATAIGEAMLMARRVAPGHRFLVPSSLFWERRSILENYAPRSDMELVAIPTDPRTGALDLGFVEREARRDCFGVLVEYPDSLGTVQRGLPGLRSAIGAVPLVVSTDPLALTLLEPPGAWGADIVVAEGQGFGLAPSFGGPLLGLMAVRRKDARQLPGRIAGASTDAQGRRAFTLTLQAREQHIRRSRATSNICTNQTLMALAFLVYATALGPRGLTELARELLRRGHDLARGLAQVPGLTAPFLEAPFLWEFGVKVEGPPVDAFLEAMAEEGVLAGVPLQDPRPSAPAPAHPGFLTSVGERTDAKAIGRFVEAARRVLDGSRRPP